MAGWVGAWKRAGLLAISGVLASACQRLEYVSDDDGDGGGGSDEGDSEDAPDSHDPTTTQDDDHEDPPAPMEDPVCFVEPVCECYGAADHDFCEPSVRQGCSYATSCDGLDPAAREDCVVAHFCDAGGHFEDDTLVCDAMPEACAGACDLDPAACDADGDGVLSFACGDGPQECELGQFCVDLATDWGCDDECSNCDFSGGGFECVSIPATCGGTTLSAQRECVADVACEFNWIEWSFGRDIRCGDNECHG